MDVRNKRSKIGLTYIGAVIMTLILYRGIPALGKSVAPFVCEFLGIDASVTVLTCVVVVTALVLLIYRLLLRKVHFKGVLSITGAGAGEAFRMALWASSLALIL